MNAEQIISIFIKACQADRRLPNTAKPKHLKAINIGYQHDADDVKDWEAEEARQTNTKNQMGLWLAALDLVKLERRESHRRSLWAWAMSKAGGMPFNKWCRSEGIHVETGRRRAKAAINAIAARFARNTTLHNENSEIRVLPEGTNSGYVQGKMAKPPTSWRDPEADAARDCILSDWQGIREARNAMRRARAR